MFKYVQEDSMHTQRVEKSIPHGPADSSEQTVKLQLRDCHVPDSSELENPASFQKGLALAEIEIYARYRINSMS